MAVKESMTPFLKWAGGKRWFALRYSEWLVHDARRYIDPFLGSGAVFFEISPKRALLSDVNRELIETYEAVRSEPSKVFRYLCAHSKRHCDGYYYTVREQRPTSDAGRAARFIYLNRTCFNGLYRVNRAGKFNVPRGTRDSVVRPEDDFEAVARTLRRATFRSGDFSALISRSGKGDFLYVDPPYTVRHNQNGFLRYNERIFSWDDQCRLASDVHAAALRGAFVLVSNANHASVWKLYRDPIWRKMTINRTSTLGAQSSSRVGCSELVISNYLEPAKAP